MGEGDPGADLGAKCRWCANAHSGDFCPVVEEIEYFRNGTVKRVKFVVTEGRRKSIQDQLDAFRRGPPAAGDENYPKHRRAE